MRSQKQQPLYNQIHMCCIGVVMPCCYLNCYLICIFFTVTNEESTTMETSTSKRPLESEQVCIPHTYIMSVLISSFYIRSGVQQYLHSDIYLFPVLLPYQNKEV